MLSLLTSLSASLFQDVGGRGWSSVSDTSAHRPATCLRLHVSVSRKQQRQKSAQPRLQSASSCSCRTGITSVGTGRCTHCLCLLPLLRLHHKLTVLPSPAPQEGNPSLMGARVRHSLLHQCFKDAPDTEQVEEKEEELRREEEEEREQEDREERRG